ncbi:MAG TPA: FRG domain-containing protein [Bryobacteraceae bacterium]|nr:FRG domain-containing protein [Bryobacteraceae bacterium]
MQTEPIPEWVRDPGLNPEEVKIDSWSDFESFYESRLRRKRGRWYFRGQRDSTWTLETTLRRTSKKVIPPANGEPYPRYPCGRDANTIGTRIELILLRAFQARASKFLQNIPEPEDTLEWLALMRHWGLPTRLIDVTTSPYVALYFALVELLHADQDLPDGPKPAVWAINHVALRGIGAEQVGVLAHTDLSGRALFNEHFLADPPVGLLLRCIRVPIAKGWRLNREHFCVLAMWTYLSLRTHRRDSLKPKTSFRRNS